MDQIIILTGIYSACIGFVWVDVLTQTRGLLSAIPRYYPERIRDKPLMCSRCFSGWLAIFWSFTKLINEFGYENIYVYIYTAICGCIAMAMIDIIKDK